MAAQRANQTSARTIPGRVRGVLAGRECRTGVTLTIARIRADMTLVTDDDVRRAGERCARISVTDSSMRNSTDWSRCA